MRTLIIILVLFSPRDIRNCEFTRKVNVDVDGMSGNQGGKLFYGDYRSFLSIVRSCLFSPVTLLLTYVKSVRINRRTI